MSAVVHGRTPAAGEALKLGEGLKLAGKMFERVKRISMGRSSRCTIGSRKDTYPMDQAWYYKRLEKR